MKLPTTQVTINGFAVSDALLDSGSQLCLIDSRVYSVIAPNVDLLPPARLLSASGHQLNAIGTCKLIVCTDGDKEGCETDFTVVHNLAHNLVLGWDFMSKNNMILNCSTEQPVKLKVRVKRPVSIPPRSAVCLSVKVDQTLCSDGEYLFLGQKSNDFEAADALIRPFSESEIPLYARNRSDHVITIHRRSVIGFI